MAASATQVRDTGRMAGVTARQPMDAAADMTARQSTGAAANMAAAEMATTHSATNMATATEVTTATKVATPVSASPATASEGLRLHRAHSQSDNRNDDSNLAQHHILHLDLGRSRVLISGYCRHSAPSGTRWPVRSLGSEPIGMRLRRLAAVRRLLRQSDQSLRWLAAPTRAVGAHAMLR
jgi:hypothetical protein